MSECFTSKTRSYGMLCVSRNPISMHDTNSPAENWMKMLKSNIMQGRKRLRPAEYEKRKAKNKNDLDFDQMNVCSLHELFD